MKVVSIANSKGGVGKTTTALSLLGCWSSVGKRVLLVDADPQASASWFLDRTTEDVEYVTETDPKALQRVRMAGGFDVVVVDTPGYGNSEAFSISLRTADYLVLPCGPIGVELKVLMDVIRNSVAPLGKPYRVLLTRVDPRSLRDAIDAQTALRKASIPTLRSFVRTYKAHALANDDGKLITTWTGSYADNAREDYEAVAQEIAEWIGMN